MLSPLYRLSIFHTKECWFYARFRPFKPLQTTLIPPDHKYLGITTKIKPTIFKNRNHFGQIEHVP